MKTSQSVSLLSGTVAPSSVPRLLSLEERVTYLETLLSLDVSRQGAINHAPTFDVEAFLTSSEGIAEFKAAIRRLATFNDMKPLEAFARKTGGKMPKEELC